MFEINLKQAKHFLPSLEKDLEDALSKRQNLDEKIDELKTMLHNFRLKIPKIESRQKPAVSSKAIEQVLRTTPNLNARQVSIQAGIAYSTCHRILTAGEGTQYICNDKNLWRLNPSSSNTT